MKKISNTKKKPTKKKIAKKQVEVNEPPRIVPIKEAFNITPPEYCTRVKHMANMGDIVASMAACKKYFDITKRQIVYQQLVNQPAQYYQGATHGTVDEQGTMVTLNANLFEMIKPLIESQEYIHSFIQYNGQRVDLDFDVVRGQTDVNMPHGMLSAWIMYAFPDLACDLSKPWLILPEVKDELVIQNEVKRKVIINFTERYRSHAPIDYYFLKNYAADLIFAGTEKEYWLFCNKWGLSIPRLEVKNFLELAYAMKACRFLMSNQSFIWNIADAMKTPRVLEVCKWADNCQPHIGEDSYGYFYQVGAEYYFRTMYNKTANR